MVAKDGIFAGTDSFTDITIPDSVTSIGKNAFRGCANLSSVHFSQNITYIGAGAFYECSSLKNISLPNSLTSIENGVFEKCSNLLNISIPDTVTCIEESAFSGCSSLNKVDIPSSVTTIGNSAFSGCSSLNEVDIPNSVTSIGESSFYNCSSLKNITISDSVVSIGRWAFARCNNLNSIIIDSNNVVYDSRNNCNAIIETCNNNLIFGCVNTIIPDTVTSIGDYAFEYCSGLTNITLPDSITSIGDYAFEYCSGLTNITLPDSVISIAQGAFYGCSNLIIYCSEDSYAYKYASNNDIKTAELIDAQPTLEYDGFKYKVDTYVKIIEGTGSETEVVIPEEIDGYKVEKIGDYAFSECSGITSITLPDSVTSIGEGAFEYCTGLTSVTIPDSVTNIEEYAFSGCSSLTSIKVDLNNIVYDSRNDCNAIIETNSNVLMFGCGDTVIPDSVIYIENYAFENCSNLSNIVIPKSVTSIGYRAFDGCENLIITCEENSYAHRYAKDNNIKYELTGSTGKKANSITCSKTYKKNMSTNAQSFKLDVKSAGGTIKYKSNNSKVKVTGSGKVTIAKNFVGTSVITVTAGNSDYETVTKKITIKVFPPSTKITTAKNNAKGKITVKWGKVSNVTGYDLQYSTNASFKTGVKTLLNKKASTTSKVITKLEKGNTYYIRIRTYKNVSGKNVYSTWSAKKKIEIKK